MVFISKSGNKTITISYFKIDSNYQKKQVDLLRDFIDNLLSKQNGFVSSTIHKGLKGSNIVNYSQWEGLKDHTIHTDHIVSLGQKSILSFATHELDNYEIIHTVGEDIMVTDQNKVITSIVYVKLNQKHQADFTNGWIKLFENVAKKQPGFISSILHTNLTGNKLLSYSHWEKRQDLESFFSLPEVFISADNVAQFSRTNWDTYEISHIREI